MIDRSDEMASYLMQVAGELHRSGKLNKRTLVEDLNTALRLRWPDVQLRELEASAVKFGKLADEFSGARPANDRGRRH